MSLKYLHRFYGESEGAFLFRAWWNENICRGYYRVHARYAKS